MLVVPILVFAIALLEVEVGVLDPFYIGTMVTQLSVVWIVFVLILLGILNLARKLKRQTNENQTR